MSNFEIDIIKAYPKLCLLEPVLWVFGKKLFNLVMFQPYLCESFYVLLEYARTAMFHWFFIEGLHLHNVLTISVFPSHSSHRVYYVIGWGVPVVMTTAWAVATGLMVDTACWYGYNHTPYYYIVEGPRLALIAVSEVQCLLE